MKWFDKKNFKYDLISEHKGEEAGIKSSTIKVEGEYLYGLMKAESGVHRLVRISPFDSGARRHTSFASVWVYPAIDDNISIKIDDKDFKATNNGVWIHQIHDLQDRQKFTDWSKYENDNPLDNK